MLLILSYHLVLTGWVLAFLLAALGGGGLNREAFSGTLWPEATFVITTVASNRSLSATLLASDRSSRSWSASRM